MSLFNTAKRNTNSYNQYRNLIDELLTNDKTTGTNHTEAYLNFTKMNVVRMKRWDKMATISSELEEHLLKALPQRWIVLTEAWCGDAAQNLPVIHKIAETSNLVNLKVVLRDDNEELMNLFLTNGGKSIPKLIALDKNNNVINSWGPRPTIAARMVANYKTQHGVIDANFKQDLQVWYNKNKGENIQDDFIKLVRNIQVEEV